MLALTHHVVVKAAALKSNIPNFIDYAVLGDDLVIQNTNSLVSKGYLHIMELLGVSINLGKSVISKDFTEFAKKYRGYHSDISPIGPGLILNTIRDKSFILKFFSDLNAQSLITIHHLQDLIRTQPRFLGRI
jgi:hypothetical protein